MGEDFHHTIGTILALSSGFFIGLSLVLQKKGLIDTVLKSGNEYEYLKSKLWWTGMACMVAGEICNFGAYAFSPAIIVTPLGAVSVVVSAICSIFFLGETLNFSGGMGILLCIIGSIQIILHAPPSTQTETIPEFFSYVITPGFIIYTLFALALMVFLLVRMAPAYGSTQPIVYLSITSIGGAFLVNAAQGLGSSIVYTVDHPYDNQFKQWPIYPLIVFTIASAIFQVNYLNKSLQYFTTSIVTPVNYVFFSTATLVTSAVLFRGFNVASPLDGVNIVLGFLVIVIGVALLFQYNLKLNKLARQKEEAKSLEEQANTSCPSSMDDECADANLETMGRMSLSDPRTDINPITLWTQTFPLRRFSLKRCRGTPPPSPEKSGNAKSPPLAVETVDVIVEEEEPAVSGKTTRVDVIVEEEEPPVSGTMTATPTSPSDVVLQ